MQLEAVLRRLKVLLAGGPEVKVLVFSTWVDVLELLAHGLSANGMPFAYAKGGNGKKFHSELSRFKCVLSHNIHTHPPPPSPPLPFPTPRPAHLAPNLRAPSLPALSWPFVPHKA